jgi:hypothetical protein
MDIAKEKHINCLLVMGNEMHPHLGDDNHTNNLIRQLFEDKTKLSKTDFFDLGKYYQRMLDNHLKIHEGTPEGELRLESILRLKWAC